MDFTISASLARDVNMLLDYYFSERDMYHAEAAACWHRLSFAAGRHVSDGWTTTQVERAFVPKPKRPDAWRYNPYDVEECEACTGHEVCPYHEGVGDGLGALRTAVDKLVDYPEQLSETLNYPDGAPSPSAPRKRNVDETCPNCGNPSRWQIPEQGLFGCDRCPWRGATRYS